MRTAFVVVAVLALLASASALSSPYKYLDRVHILVNTVGSLYNPAEVFPYYSLPFCAPKEAVAHGGSLGDAFAGNRKQTSLYDIRFKVDIQWQSLCTFRLTQDDIKLFMDAIKRDYVYEMFVDGLQLQGFIGGVSYHSKRVDSHVHNETRFHLFTHLDFTLAHNGNHVIAVNVTADPRQRLELAYGENLNVEFSYSAHWKETSVTYADRDTLHSKSRIGHDTGLEVHWLSIVNSFVLVLLLTVFLAFILMRILRNDFARYLDVDDEDIGLDGVSQRDDSGWKMIYGDVFRVPSRIMLFTACVGTGTQLLFILACVLFFAVLGQFAPGQRSALYSAAIVLYAITSSIAGYISCWLYTAWGGDKWATNAVFTACLFAAPFFAVFSFVNSVALAHQSSVALPFSTIAVIILLWSLVTFPLTVFGAMRGRAASSKYDPPCKPNRVPREVPAVPFYRTATIQILLAGFLPFSAIYIELHYLFSAVWGHHVYTVFGILCLAFVMLLIVTSFVTIALTYFQLSAEDYHWWWRSFFSGGSIAIFVLGYAFYFFFFRSAMHGFLQTTFFFGYVSMIVYGVFLMLGSVGFFSSYKFVSHIYNTIKSD